MKIMVYSFNEADERAFFDELCSEAEVEYVTCPDYPSLDNAHLAKGCEAIRIQVCDMNRELALLSSFPNVIVSPHTAFYTDVSIRDMAQCTVEAACAFARGEDTPFEVK